MRVSCTRWIFQAAARWIHASTQICLALYRMRPSSRDAPFSRFRWRTRTLSPSWAAIADFHANVFQVPRAMMTRPASLRQRTFLTILRRIFFWYTPSHHDRHRFRSLMRFSECRVSRTTTFSFMTAIAMSAFDFSLHGTHDAE